MVIKKAKVQAETSQGLGVGGDMTEDIEYIDHFGVVLEIKSPIEFVIDCSCWLCDEYGTIHCKQPHGLILNIGDWVLVRGGPIYNCERVYSTGNYTYVWEVDADGVMRSTKEEEIRHMEEAGQTDCGRYDTLTGRKPP